MNLVLDAAVTWLAAAVVFDESGPGCCCYLAGRCYCILMNMILDAAVTWLAANVTFDVSGPGRCCYLASQ